MLSPGFTILVFAVGAVLVAGSVIPSAGAWAGDVVDVDVRAVVEWHPVKEEWTVGAPESSVRESKLIDFKSYFRNALLFGTSGKRPVIFTIETPAGQVVDRIQQSSGKGGIFGSEKTLSVTFREIPPGEYVLRVALTDEGGKVVEQKAPLRLVPVGGG